MTTWTNDELTRIEHAEELQMAASRGDGTPRAPVPIWVVRDGDDLYVRSGGVHRDVTLVEVTDAGVNDRIDAAYRTKYGRHGASYVDPMVASRDTTLKLVPR